MAKLVVFTVALTDGSNKDYATRDWLRNSSRVSPFSLTRRLLVFQWMI